MENNYNHWTNQPSDSLRNPVFYPILTEVMFDYEMMLEMVYHSMTIIERGFDTVWDSNIIYFTMKYFKEGVDFAEKLVKERGIKMRIIIQTTKENIDYVSPLKYLEVRCLEDLKGNFGIFDNRAYMVYIFHRDSDKPDQTLWSNSKMLVDKQQSLFDKLWDIAIPLSLRRKEIEYEHDIDSQITLTCQDEIQREIQSLILTSKKELTIFSSTKILCSVLYKKNFIEYFHELLNKDVTIKLLTDNIDDHLISQISSINNKSRSGQIQSGYSTKLGKLDELVLISDGRYVLHIKYNNGNNLEATLSKEEHTVLVQEILFEKYWDEVKSLTAALR